MAKIPCEYSGGVIKSATFSGTTSASGDVSIGINKSTGKIVVGAYDSVGANLIIPRLSTTGDWYLHYERYSGGSWSPLVNTSVSGTYYYANIE